MDNDENDIITPDIIPPASLKETPTKANVLTHISNILSEATATEEIIHSLEIGANCYSRQTNEEAPSNVIPVNVWKSIIIHACNISNPEISFAALRFLKQSLSIDRKFDLGNIKKIEDVDLIECLSEVFGREGTEADELIISIVTYVAKRSEEDRDHVLEFFGLDRVRAAAESSPEIYGTYLHFVMTISLYRVTSEEALSHTHEVASFIESMAGKNSVSNDEKNSLYYAVAALLHLGSWMEDMAEQIMEHEAFFEAIEVFFPSGLYVLDEAVLRLILHLLRADKSLDLEGDLDPHSLLEFIEYVDPETIYYKRRERLTLLAMRVTAVIIDRGNTSVLPLLKAMHRKGESKVGEMLRIVQRCTGRLRSAAVDVCRSIAECDSNGAFMMLNKGSVRKIAPILDSDAPEELFPTLHLLCALAGTARRFGLIDTVVDQLDYCTETLMELRFSDSKDISDMALEVCLLCGLCCEEEENKE